MYFPYNKLNEAGDEVLALVRRKKHNAPHPAHSVQISSFSRMQRANIWGLWKENKSSGSGQEEKIQMPLNKGTDSAPFTSLAFPGMDSRQQKTQNETSKHK